MMKTKKSILLKECEKTATWRKNHLVGVLDMGDDALLARIHLIRSAKEEILVQTFIWKDDAVGKKMMFELFSAAKRGVKVRLLIDFWIIREEKELLNYQNVNHENFKVKYFNPPAEKLAMNALDFAEKSIFDFVGINHRMHNKVFMVDGKAAIVGGRNYDNTYYDRGETRNFIDMDLMVCGPVLKDIRESFELFWDSELSIDSHDFEGIEDNSLKGSYEKFNEIFKKEERILFDDLDAEANDQKLIKNKFVDRLEKVNRVEFVYDIPGKARNNQSVCSQKLIKFLTDTKKEICIQSPYLVLSDESINFVKQLKKKRPNLDIIVSTNSMAATDNIYAFAFLFKELKIYVKDLGFRVFQLKPVPKDIKTFLSNRFYKDEQSQDQETIFKKDNTFVRKGKHVCIHSKIFISDDKAWVGTFNADVRSENINTEIGLIVEDKKITKILKDKILNIIESENSWTVAPKKYVPILTEINDELTSLSAMTPFVDLWPFRNVTCYEHIAGKDKLSISDKNFHQSYKDVGAFPQVGGNLKERELKIRLIQMFGQILKPLI